MLLYFPQGIAAVYQLCCRQFKLVPLLFFWLLSKFVRYKQNMTRTYDASQLMVCWRV